MSPFASAQEVSRDSVAESLAAAGVGEQLPASPEPQAAQEVESKPADDWRSALSADMREAEPAATAPEATDPGDDTDNSDRKQAEKREAATRNGPASWRAGPKAKWAALDPEVKEEVLRREREISSYMGQSSRERAFADGIRQTVAPYEPMFQQAGLSTPQAIGNVLQKYAALQTAPPQVRSQIIGQLIRDHLGTDEAAIAMLAAAVEGGAPARVAPAQPSPEQIAQVVERQVAARYEQAHRQDAAQTVQRFMATRPEHLNEVAAELTALIQVEESRGISKFSMDELRQLYDRACWANPKVRGIEQQREEAKRAATTNAATKKAKASAVSVKSTPVGPAAPPEPGDDWRSHLEASMDRLGGESGDRR